MSSNISEQNQSLENVTHDLEVLRHTVVRLTLENALRAYALQQIISIKDMLGSGDFDKVLLMVTVAEMALGGPKEVAKLEAAMLHSASKV